jgi:ketosteroid isomerase-like protein
MTVSITPHDEIRNVIGRYSRAVDERNFEAVGKCFTEDAVASYSGLTIPRGREHIVEHISGVARTAMSQHFLLPIIVDVHDETTAQTLCYGLAVLIQKSEDGERSVCRGLRYADTWRRTDAGWQISERMHSADWTWDLPALMNPGAMWHVQPDADTETTIFRSI